jgi:hypothetical protein
MGYVEKFDYTAGYTAAKFRGNTAKFLNAADKVQHGTSDIF